MKKITFLIMTAVFVLAFSAFVWAERGDGRLIDAEEAGTAAVPIYGASGSYYIAADSSGDFVYIADEEGNRLSEKNFKCVCSSTVTSFGDAVDIRYIDSDDLSGFAVLDLNTFEDYLEENNYYYITENSSVQNSTAGIKRDEEGNLVPYEPYTKVAEDGSKTKMFFDRELYSAYGFSSCSRWAEETLKEIQKVGLIPDTFYLRWFKYDGGTRRFDLIYMAVQAYMLKNNTDISSYIAENELTLDYDKYIDVVCPDVLVACELGLVKPGLEKYFNPNETITRQEAAYTLNRLCQLLGIETEVREKLYEDDEKIADWAKEAVYNVTGTPVEDAYIMADSADVNFSPEGEYNLEYAVLSVWRVYSCDALGTTESVCQNKKYIGCNIYLFQNADGKWGAMNDEGEIIVEAVYELAGAYVNKAVDNIFVLSDEGNYYSGRNNTYYVFDTEGNLLKTIKYGQKEMADDGHSGGSTYVYSATGSNLLFWTHYGDNIADPEEREGFSFIKRLMSEKTAAEEYERVLPYGDEGLFTAKLPSTGEKVILNPDGSFKEYYTEEEE